MADLEQTPVATQPGHRRRPAPRRAWATSFIVVLVLMATCMAIVRATSGDPHPAPGLTTVRLIAGSESEPLLTDKDMLAAFRNHGFDVRVDPEGSREIATDPRTCTNYDLALPSSQPMADETASRCERALGAIQVFTSPMVVVTYQDVVPALVNLGIAARAADGIWTFDMTRYTQVVHDKTRWSSPQAGSPQYRYSQRQVLLSSTDPRTSNSAAMYAAMLSYVLNGDSPVTDDAQVRAQLPEISEEYFRAQGYKPPSTLYNFEDYVDSLGEAVAPIALVYEAQYIELAVMHPDLVTQKHMVLMYPSPTAVADHTAVPMDANGEQIEWLLNGHTPDPDIPRIEARHGWRTFDANKTFLDLVQQYRLPVQSQINVAPPPDYEYFEELLNGL